MQFVQISSNACVSAVNVSSFDCTLQVSTGRMQFVQIFSNAYVSAVNVSSFNCTLKVSTGRTQFVQISGNAGLHKKLELQIGWEEGEEGPTLFL